jgi:hypothetical protein
MDMSGGLTKGEHEGAAKAGTQEDRNGKSANLLHSMGPFKW